MAKQKVQRRAVSHSQQKQATTFKERWERFSFSQKVMGVFSILIVLSMVLALFGSFASHGG